MNEVYYIGGSPCSGKSTVAEQMAEDYGLLYFKIDDYLGHYLAQGNQDRVPILQKAFAMNQQEMWMRDPQALCDEEFEIYEAMFPYIQRDIEEKRARRPVITEAAALLPHLMGEAKVPENRFCCLVPTREFQVEHYQKRPWISQFLSELPDPKQAFANWMERDALFALRVLEEAKAWSYPAHVVDGSQGIEETRRFVEGAFGWTGA